MKIWTEEEDRYLKKNCGKVSYKEMARVLERSPGAVRTRVYNLDLSPKKRGSKPTIAQKVWSDEEIEYLLANIRDKDFEEMEFLLKRGRTPGAIKGKAQALNLLADRRPSWTKKEDDMILEKYRDDVAYQEMQKALPHRTAAAIKARVMKLLSRF